MSELFTAPFLRLVFVLFTLSALSLIPALQPHHAPAAVVDQVDAGDVVDAGVTELPPAARPSAKCVDAADAGASSASQATAADWATAAAAIAAVVVGIVQAVRQR